MKPIVAVAVLCLCTAVPGVAQIAPQPDVVSLIHTDDVYRFYQLYDAAGGHPTVDRLQHDYLEKGSDGLRELEKIRNTTAQRIADAIAKDPRIYENARRCLAVLPGVQARLGAALRKFAAYYPEIKYRPITIVVGRGRPVGVTNSRDGYIIIGLEALCMADWMNPDPEERFVHTLAHEYAHLQQPSSMNDDEHPTVLEAALIEGTAEFVAELVSGDIGYHRFDTWPQGREKEIEEQFVPDEDKTDLSKWFYNTKDATTGYASPDWPGDVGYWVGYRIVKSYYQRAADKREALREILQMTDPHAFLTASGWKPGIALN
jgi:hypothetical protein